MTAAATETPRRATALPPEERRASIIDAVLPLLAEYGELITTRQIADAAGIAEGTIFRVFADKDELLSAALEAALDPAPLEVALAGIDPSLPFEQRLIEATEIIQRRVFNVWAIVSNLGSQRREQAERPMIESPGLVAIFEAHRERLRIEPHSAARMLRALTLSLTHPMLVGKPVPADEIVSTMLYGIALPPVAASGETGSR